MYDNTLRIMYIIFICVLYLNGIKYFKSICYCIFVNWLLNKHFTKIKQRGIRIGIKHKTLHWLI